MTLARSVILLMPELEAEFFRDQIYALVPDLPVFNVNDAKALHIALRKSESPCHLFGFFTSIYVPQTVLSQLSRTYNLHPGPPALPGYRPTHFAYLRSATTHGVTLHEMAERLDSGAIVATRSFQIDCVDSLEKLEIQTYKEALKLAQENLDLILGMKKPAPYLGEDWSGLTKTKQDLEDLQAKSERSLSDS